jgi:hypothetical protein
MKKINLFLICAVAIAPVCFAQDNATPAAVDAASATEQPQPGSTTPDAASLSNQSSESRWLDLNTLSLGLRWRDTANSDGYHNFDTGQERSLIDGRLKLDAEGKYSINFHVSSGRTFNWGYSDVIGTTYAEAQTGVVARLTPAELQGFGGAAFYDAKDVTDILALKSNGWDMYVRQLYFSAAPVKQLELEYGSLAIAKGYSTEITTYDDDGYIAGERLRIRDPKHLFVDEISVTFAYEGDIYDPNFFTRGERLGQSNYHQFLAAKSFDKRFKASLDFTEDKGTHVMREAALVGIGETRVLDGARVELYQRTNDITLQQGLFPSGSGFAFTGTKLLAKKRFKLEGGFADIDKNYAALLGSRLLAQAGFSMNADTFGIGQRVFGRASLQVTPYFTLFGFYTHLTKVDGFDGTNQGMNFGGTIDFKEMLSKKLHLL